MENRKLKYSSEPEYEKIYKNILSEVGVGGRYLYAVSGDPLTSILDLDSLKTPYIGLCAGTGSTVQMKVYSNFTIDEGAEVVIVRVLRPCNHNGIYHANADDYMYFPDTKGNFIVAKIPPA